MPVSGSSRSSSRHSSRSTASSGSTGSQKDYTLSVNVYGRGDPRKDDPPAHWGTMLHKRGDTHGDLHHVRKQDDFYYEDPVQRRAVESNTSYGRHEVQHLSSRRKDAAEQVLNTYGRNNQNLPTGTQNCQNWTVGALGALEQQRLAPRGTQSYWQQNVGQSSQAIGNRLQQDGRSWIPRTAPEARQGPADAGYRKKEEARPVGRLNMAKFAGLSGNASKR